MLDAVNSLIINSFSFSFLPLFSWTSSFVSLSLNIETSNSSSSSVSSAKSLMSSSNSGKADRTRSQLIPYLLFPLRFSFHRFFPFASLKSIQLKTCILKGPDQTKNIPSVYIKRQLVEKPPMATDHVSQETSAAQSGTLVK